MDISHMIESSNFSTSTLLNSRQLLTSTGEDESTLMRMRKLYHIVMNKSVKSRFEEKKLCRTNVVKFLDAHLSSSSERARCLCLNLLCCTIPRLADKTDSLLKPIIPKVISCLGDNFSKDLQLKAMHLLRTYYLHTSDALGFIDQFVRHGVASGSVAIRTLCFYGASIVFDRDVGNEHFAQFIAPMADSLENTQYPLAFLAAYRALRRIHENVPDQRFRELLAPAGKRAKDTYMNFLTFEDTDSYLNCKTTSSSDAIKEYQKKRVRIKLGKAFGIIDPALLDQISLNEGCQRAVLVHNFASIIKLETWKETDLICHIPDLLKLLSVLVVDSNKPIQMSVYSILKEIISRMGFMVGSHLKAIIEIAQNSFASPNSKIQRKGEAVIHKLMRKISTMTVVWELLKIPSESGRVAVMKIVISRLKSCPYYEFDLLPLCLSVGHFLEGDNPFLQSASRTCVKLILEVIRKSPLCETYASVVDGLVQRCRLQPSTVEALKIARTTTAADELFDFQSRGTSAASTVPTLRRCATVTLRTRDLFYDNRREFPPDLSETSKYETSKEEIDLDVPNFCDTSRDSRDDSRSRLMQTIGDQQTPSLGLRESRFCDRQGSISDLKNESARQNAHRKEIRNLTEWTDKCSDTPRTLTRRYTSTKELLLDSPSSKKSLFTSNTECKEDIPDPFRYRYSSESKWLEDREDIGTSDRIGTKGSDLLRVQDHDHHKFCSTPRGFWLPPLTISEETLIQSDSRATRKAPLDSDADRRKTRTILTQSAADDDVQCLHPPPPREYFQEDFQSPSSPEYLRRQETAGAEDSENSCSEELGKGDAPPVEEDTETPSPVKKIEKRTTLEIKTPEIIEEKNETTPKQDTVDSYKKFNGKIKGCPWKRELEYATKGDACTWAEEFKKSAEQLKPFQSSEEAEAELKVAMGKLEEKSWKEKEEAMLCVLRLAKHQQDLLCLYKQKVVFLVCAEVQNFRQSVAGKAVLTLGILHAFIGKRIENNLRLVVKTLLAKSSNRTLAAYFRLVIRSIFQVVQCTSAHKAALAFVQEGSRHANKANRETAAQFLMVIAEHLGPQESLLKPIVPAMLKSANDFVTDCSALCRYCGKRMFQVFIKHPDFENLKIQFLDSHQDEYQKNSLKETLQQIKEKGVPEEILPINVIQSKVNG